MPGKPPVSPPIERYCLGPPVPARRPRPAATTMAAVRRDSAMGFLCELTENEGPALTERTPLPRGARKIERFHVSGVPAFACRFAVVVGEQMYAALHLQDELDCLKCRHGT